MSSQGSECSYNCLKGVLIAPIQHKKLLLAIVLLLLFYTCTGRNLNNTQFDYLIFSQRWLPTACVEYMEHGSRSGNPHNCVLPKNFKFWAIHGLWPTKYKHMGPFYCNRSMPFDSSKLLPIESDIESYWPNIEEGKSTQSLWQHEWEKHGTCATQMVSLNTEIKYFSTTLKFFKTHNVQDLFKRNNILPSPNPGLNASDLISVIQKAYGKLPQIHCINEVKSHQPYLSEIRLCYSKNLELMDCRSIRDTKFNTNVNLKESLTNCPPDEKILFPGSINVESVNKLVENSEKAHYYDRMVELLRFLRFLQWASI